MPPSKQCWRRSESCLCSLVFRLRRGLHRNCGLARVPRSSGLVFQEWNVASVLPSLNWKWCCSPTVAAAARRNCGPEGDGQDHEGGAVWRVCQIKGGHQSGVAASPRNERSGQAPGGAELYRGPGGDGELLPFFCCSAPGRGTWWQKDFLWQDLSCAPN